MIFTPFETSRLRLRPQEERDAGSCGVMRSLDFALSENGTFHRSGSSTEYKNLTFQKVL